MIDALDALVALGPDVQLLPRRLRAVHAEEHLRALEPMKDPNSRGARIERLFASESALWVAGTTLAAPMIRHSTVCGQMDNPGSNQVRQFLALLDVDIENYLQSVGKASLLKQVNGLVARRNAIAHGEATMSATFSDLDSYLATVEDICTEIDDRISLAVQTICSTPTRPW